VVRLIPHLMPWSPRLLAWQAWRLVIAISILRGRYDTYIQLAIQILLDYSCNIFISTPVPDRFFHTQPFHTRLFPTGNFYTPRLYTYFFHQQHFYTELFHAPPFDIYFLHTPILYFFSFSCLSHPIFTFLWPLIGRN
jgi:hypothetical protein